MTYLAKILTWLISPNQRLLSVTLLYYACLYFVNANIWLILITCLYLFGVFLITRQPILSLWLVLLATLPFAKGKTLSITLLSAVNLDNRNAIFDVGYILGFYLSDFILFLLCWKLTQQLWLQSKQIKTQLAEQVLPSWQIWSIVVCWLGFVVVAVIPHSRSFLWPVIGLSTLELFKLTLIFFLPSWMLKIYQSKTAQRDFMHGTAKVLLASLFFQAFWSVWQYYSGGPLGAYIEAILPLGPQGEAMAISTNENTELLRVTGTFFDPSLLATFIGTLMAWFRFNQSAIKPKGLYWLAMIAGTITIILTSNRMLMFMLLGWYLWEFKIWADQQPNFLTQIKKFFTPKRLLLVTATVIVLFSWLNPYIVARMTTLNQIFDKYGSATYRLQLGWYAIRLSLDHPFGVGLNLSPYFLATGFNQESVSFDPSHPHNIFLQLFAETGWVGLGLVFGLIYFLYRPVVKSNNQTEKSTLSWQMSGWGWSGLMFLICAQFYPVFINQIEVVSWLAIMLGGHWAFRLGLLKIKSK